MRKLFTNKNKKGFAMAELLAVSIVLLFIFSILFSNYLPLLAEYETRLSYNDVTAQYAAHYIRKMYMEALKDEGIRDQFSGVTDGTDAYKTVYKYDPNKNTYENTNIYGHIINDTNDAKKTELENIIKEYGIEEIIITKYKLKGNKDATETTKYVKDEDGYKKDAGYLYNYINYLPNYEKSIYTGNIEKEEGEQLYRLILKTKDFGYATTPILSDYKTPSSCFEGESNDTGITITKYKYNEENGCGKTVIIKNTPVTINGISGKITAIGEGVFEKRDDENPAYQVEEVILSDRVETIGKNSFKGSNLKELPDLRKVNSIGDYAFYNTKITEADLTDYPSSSTIGDYAFSSNENLKTVNFSQSIAPSTSITVGNYAFANNKNLGTVTLPNANIFSPEATLTKGLFKESGTSAGGIAVAIPGGMKYVGDEMFYLAKINGITLNDGVQTIGVRAFSQYKNENKEGKGIASTMIITSNVKSIGEDSFRGLNITTLTFNDGNVPLSIGTAAFKDNSVTTLDIPSRIVKIESSAFENSGIQNLTFEDGSQLNNIPYNIPSFAFAYNQLAGTLIIPDRVTTIEEKAFIRNKSEIATQQELAVTLPVKIKKIGIDAFSNNNLINITIPNTVITIGARAFKNTNLSNVNFVSGGTENLVINSGAFSVNKNLAEFTIPSRTESIGDNVFSDIATDAKIYNNSKELNYSDNITWCSHFALNATTCDVVGPDDENKLTITYTNKNTTNTRYVYNMGGVTNE